MDVIRFEENSSEGWTSYSLSTTQYSEVIEPEQECTCLCRICMKSWISCWLPLCIWPVCDAHCVFAWLSRGRAGGIWCGNARGHNQACLKCKIGCSKYSYLISKEYKFEHSSWDFVTHNSQISFIVFDTTCSHDHIAAAYTNYQRIDRLLALWLKLTPVKSLKCEVFFSYTCGKWWCCFSTPTIMHIYTELWLSFSTSACFCLPLAVWVARLPTVSH